MKIVFLHGIGDGDPDMIWLDGLNRGLAAHGKEPVPASEVLAPRYASFLSTEGLGAKMPAPNSEPKDNTAARHEFQRRRARIRRSLAEREDVRAFGSIGYHRVPGPVLHAGQAAAVGSGTTFLNLHQVGRYVNSEPLRGAVLRYVLDQLPSGAHDLVLIGHSLGSVIAIDLLDHLPDRFRVRRFLTVGSPAGSPVLHRDGNRMSRRFPYSRVDDWTNVLDVGDVVTGGRGLASIFGAAQDVVVDIRGQHGAGLYLGHGAVSGLIAEVLYPSRELVPISVHLTVRMSDDDANNLLTLHYAHAVAGAVKDKTVAERYRGGARAGAGRSGGGHRTFRPGDGAGDTSGDRRAARGPAAAAARPLGTARTRGATDGAVVDEPGRALRHRHRARPAGRDATDPGPARIRGHGRCDRQVARRGARPRVQEGGACRGARSSRSPSGRH
ncbi:hypothetical protein F8M49_09360 [Rhodococcus zopfii]|uniref:Uncharacterized protein n=1 Tax=Rhodococcus zopfii TaxID=43772 RepID=A0ABU3WNN0_9NOCA|nr:hypothetical protein [Rhodococcus zopfii]